ncbi:epsin-1 isoform X1 [Oncorhynchus tshawytscha]|uniref:ENTH domain-containing protein n=1 Tax=Oncorhynchus tshawytscha TaxID=74940 RepID=A0A8C8BYK2_ONCTS|nr:epsin-1 isoform X1 [Oncorhynchus tshawytscha]XP_024297482.1 epsin-1 isoform X1 [Oncorhynchus tshawytscha]
MTSSMLRRQLKNLVQNFSEAEVKVREATSNDPWGPSSSQMADISDLTYNVVACNEIMTMLWKRLKDDKNWRHIYKSLTLLENLLKTGSDRVLNTMKDNIYIVKALTEFRFQDKDGKDQGVNVREKAKVVLVLMEDDEKLKEERESALKTRDKISKNATASSDDPNDPKDPNYKPVYVPGATGLPSLANIPSVADLAASFEAKKQEKLRLEAQKKEEERRSKMTKEELEWEDAAKAGKVADAFCGADAPSEEDAWGAAAKTPAPDPWGVASKAPSEDAWGGSSKAPSEDAWGAPSNATTEEADPFAAPASAPTDGSDPFAATIDGSDPFSAPSNASSKVEADPFGAPKDDPFSAPSNTSKDGSDLFGAPKDDPFSAPSNTPKGGSDLFGAPKDDPFSAPSNTPKGGSDPFGGPKDDPFSAPSNTPKGGSDPFGAPKEDPFSGPSNMSKDGADLFGAPTEDPFSAPSNMPKDNSDPFGAPLNNPTKGADPFRAPSSPPTEASDAWGAPSNPPSEKKADPWGDEGTTAASPPADPFGDGSKADDDAWGPPASTPPTASDPWGATAAPTDTASTSDPWGDGGASTTTDTMNSDPWGAPSNGTDNGAAADENNKSPASFLGAGASLVNMDSLLSSEPKQPPLNVLAKQQSVLQGPGPMGRVTSIAGVSRTTIPPNSSLFGSTAMSYGVTHPSFRSPNTMLGTPLSQLSSHSLGMPRPGLAMPAMGPQMAPPCFGAVMVQPNCPGVIPQAGHSAVAHLGASTPPMGRGVPLQPHMVLDTGMGEPLQQNNNPFLF